MGKHFLGMIRPKVEIPESITIADAAPKPSSSKNSKIKNLESLKFHSLLNENA